MQRFRLFLTWLLLAALPLQGLAAASMLYCSPGVPPVQAQVQTGPAKAQVHEHASHAHPGAELAQTVDGANQLPDASHQCGVCSACCHLQAMTELSVLQAFSAAPNTELSEPQLLFQARPLPVPDKPPRV